MSFGTFYEFSLLFYNTLEIVAENRRDNTYCKQLKDSLSHTQSICCFSLIFFLIYKSNDKLTKIIDCFGSSIIVLTESFWTLTGNAKTLQTNESVIFYIRLQGYKKVATKMSYFDVFSVW